MGAFAWPAAVVVLGIVAILTFRLPLQRLIDRTKKVSRDGIEAEQQIQPASAQTPRRPLADPSREFDNDLLLEREDEIRAHLDEIGATDSVDRERWLVRQAASVSLSQAFGAVYAAIYGSQIVVLQLLNSAGPGGTEVEDLRPFFEQAARNEPEVYADDTLDRWLGFLEGSSLTVRTGDAVSITTQGREFLKYVVHQGYSLFKRG